MYVYTVIVYTSAVHPFILSISTYSQKVPVMDPDPLSVEDSGFDGSDGSGDESGSSGDTGGDTSEENQQFIDTLDERCENLDNANEELGHLQAEMAEQRDRIAKHRSQLARIRKDCGLLPWHGNPVTMIKIRTVRNRIGNKGI